MDAFVGEIRAFGFNFQPVDWIPCDGRLLPVSQYQALFAVIGTIYGGTGNPTFAVPDLRGRPPMHSGTATGTPPAMVGNVVGAPSVTLTVAQMASHSHGAQAVFSADPTTYAAGPGATAYPAAPRNGAVVYDAWTTNAPTTTLSPLSISPSGGTDPHSNISPYLTMNMCICTQGEFPIRG